MERNIEVLLLCEAAMQSPGHIERLLEERDWLREQLEYARKENSELRCQVYDLIVHKKSTEAPCD